TDAIGYLVEGSDKTLLASVPAALVRKFLQEYRISDAHMDLKEDMLLGYLDAAQTRLPAWNVGIITSSEGPPAEADLGPLGRVGTVRRAKLTDTGTVFA